MKFQFISDVHLEIDPVSKLREFIKPCGDICAYSMKDRLRSFLEFCAASWQRVFYVAGNHEYYNKSSHELRFIAKQDAERGQPTTLLEVENWLRTECDRFPNVHFLQKDSYYLAEEGTYVLGCTLWSEIPADQYDIAKKGMVDYRRIYLTKEAVVTPAQVTGLYYDHANWLLGELNSLGPQVKVLVITHHLPTYQMVDAKYAGNPLNCCFASSTLERLPRVPATWVCGHSHSRTSRVVNGCLCVLNARGYPGEMPKMTSSTVMPVVEIGMAGNGQPVAAGAMLEAPPPPPKPVVAKKAAAVAAVDLEEEVDML